MATLALGAASCWAGVRLRLPSGALLAPLLAGLLAPALGWPAIHLPNWLTAATYCVIGWAIGLKFNGETLRAVARSLPWMLAATLALVALCAAIGALLARWGGIDPLTAFLATSPGGIDAVALLAASSGVDMGFVMGLQTARLVLLLALGPVIVRWVVRRLGDG